MLNNQKLDSQTEEVKELDLKMAHVVNNIDAEITELEAKIKLLKNNVSQYYSFKETEITLANVLLTLNTCRNGLNNDFEKIKSNR